MDKRKIKLILKKYANELNKNIDFKKLILYGSYARGTANKDSDIDAAVVIKELRGDFLESSALLWKLAANIDTRIEPVLIEEDKDVSGFLDDILKYGIVIVSN